MHEGKHVDALSCIYISHLGSYYDQFMTAIRILIPYAVELGNVYSSSRYDLDNMAVKGRYFKISFF